MNKKYFIAIVLPQPFLNEIENIKSNLHTTFGLKGALRSPAHITLHRPFEWKEEKEDTLKKSLAKFNKINSFNIEIRNFNYFEKRVIYADVISNDVLTFFQKNLVLYTQNNLKIVNELTNAYGFKPHVTVAFRDLKKNKFDSVWNELLKIKVDFVFKCEAFNLLKFDGKKWEVISDFELIS